jgi:hypothetical protein
MRSRWWGIEELAMPIALRADFDASHLRAAVRASKNAGQTRRLLALAAIYDGASRSEAAGIGGVTLPAANASRFGEIVRDWVVKLKYTGRTAWSTTKDPVLSLS